MGVLRFLGKLIFTGFLCAIFGLTAWFSFLYFLKGRSVSVPDLAGKRPDEARRILADKGLDFSLEPDLARYDEAVPAERVLSQNPRAGTPVKQGASVRVALSLGPRILAVPDLAGQTSRTASLQLDRLGLRLGTVTNLAVPGVAGVISQDPPAGQRANPGSSVSVLIARDPGAPRRLIPDLVGRDVDSARSELEAFGYRLGTIRNEGYEGVGDGRILRQYPLAGYPAPPGAVVTLTVSRGNA